MKKARHVYFAIIIISLVIISTSIYYVLGGFNELKVYVLEGTARTVIGKHHIGKLPARRVYHLLQESKALIDSGKLKGKLTLVEYQNDTIGKDSLHLFIGASFDEIQNVLEIPFGFSYEEYQTDEIYRVYITRHPLVISPGRVGKMIRAKSAESNKELQPYSFDIYYTDGSKFTEGWVK